MRHSNEQFRVQISPHKKLPRTAQGTRRLSGEAKQKESILHRLRQKGCPPSLSLENQKDSNAVAQNNRNAGCLNTLFHKEIQYQQFADKCFSYLSRKKLSTADGSDSKPSTFSTMLQNIKKSIKENDRRERDKEQSPPASPNDLMCVRGQIHQIYNSDEKMELYKMIKSNQTRMSKREIGAKPEKAATQEVEHAQSGSKFIINPLFGNRTIVCFTMALNQPQIVKKPLFEAPVIRNISTSVSKRVVQISKPSYPRAMCFQVSGDGDNQYMKRLKNFLDFLFKVNFSNNIYIPFQLAKPDENTPIYRYKAYVGKGNNSLLIKSLLKRRFWWQIVDNSDSSVNFYWSQNIVQQVHESQKLSLVPIGLSQKITKKKNVDQFYELNRKILPVDKCQAVQKYILKDGYMIPCDEVFLPDLISNHLPRNYCIGSKKNLFKSLFHFFTKVKQKNPFDYIPKTYHIKSVDSAQYKQFVKENRNEPNRVWIIKPGQNTNRGNGINLSTFSSIQSKLRKIKHENGQQLTYIVQSYINRPFLYNNRKFDIRHYLLLVSVNGILKAYWYRQGYIRTSSEYFDLDDLSNLFIHLTNDAVQRKSEDYEKFEPANKLSYSQFQRYLDYTHPAKNYNFQRDIIPKMKEIASYIVRANYTVIDHRRHQNNFEIFGLDFMIDRDFKPWLIEVNYNPCLEVNCAVLERIIPAMVENSLRIGLDPLFPPTAHFPASKRFYLTDHYLKNLRYELIFDEESVGEGGDSNYDFVEEKEEEEEYLDEGQEINELMV